MPTNESLAHLKGWYYVVCSFESLPEKRKQELLIEIIVFEQLI